MFTFGIPTKRSRAVVKYPDKAVISVLARPEEINGVSYRIKFNDGPAKQLFAGSAITIGNVLVGTDNKTFFVSTNNIPADQPILSLYRVANNGNLNNQQLWKHLREIFKVEQDEFHLVLTEEIIEGVTVYTAKKYIDEPVDTTPSVYSEVETIPETVEESIGNIDGEAINHGDSGWEDAPMSAQK